MNTKKENKHTIDALFVIALFFAFALSSLTLIALGANVYRGIVDHMSQNSVERTAYAYITHKLRQYDDSTGSFYVEAFGDTNALIIATEINGVRYKTYLYEYEGYLCEMIARSELDMSPSDGTRIMEMNELTIKAEGGGLYSFTICPADGNEMQLLVNTHSETINTGGGEYE